MSNEELQIKRLNGRVGFLESVIGASIPEHFSPMELNFLFTCLSEASDSLSPNKDNRDECEAIQRMIGKLAKVPGFDFDTEVYFDEIGVAQKI